MVFTTSLLTTLLSSSQLVGASILCDFSFLLGRFIDVSCTSSTDLCISPLQNCFWNRVHLFSRGELFCIYNHRLFLYFSVPDIPALFLFRTEDEGIDPAFLASEEDLSTQRDYDHRSHVLSSNPDLPHFHCYVRRNAFPAFPAIEATSADVSEISPHDRLFCLKYVCLSKSWDSGIIEGLIINSKNIQKIRSLSTCVAQIHEVYKTQESF